MSDSIGPLQWAAQAVFYGVSAVTLTGAFITVYARNLFRAAIGLALSLFGVAALYLFMDAEFLAAVQLLVYVGAILTLLVFGVMLTARIADPRTPRWNAQGALGALAAAVLGGGILFAILQTPWNLPATPPQPVPLAAVGRALISAYLLPFEVLSLLLVGALVGAVMIARKEKA
jgi:NADH-quinone oxidoreductase subunit J